MPAMKTQNRNFEAMHLVTQRRPGVNCEYVTHLLRRSYREGGKVKKETIANLTHVPERILDGLRSLLAGKELVDVDSADLFLGPGRTHPHPFLQDRDFLLGQLPLGTPDTFGWGSGTSWVVGTLKRAPFA